MEKNFPRVFHYIKSTFKSWVTLLYYLTRKKKKRKRQTVKKAFFNKKFED